ncbi:hypothetical protein GCM10027093_09290 [Paraburkholderia jirisanensis]
MQLILQAVVVAAAAGVLVAAGAFAKWRCDVARRRREKAEAIRARARNLTLVHSVEAVRKRAVGGEW